MAIQQQVGRGSSVISVDTVEVGFIVRPQFTKMMKERGKQSTQEKEPQGMGENPGQQAAESSTFFIPAIEASRERERERERQKEFEFFIQRMTVLGHGLIFQQVYLIHKHAYIIMTPQ